VPKQEAVESSQFDFDEHCKYIECSSLSGVGVKDVFKELQEQLLRRAKDYANKAPETSCCNLI
jgi:GTPase SAR1 family protein